MAALKDRALATGLRERPRRLRANEALRELLAETDISASQLIMPYFVAGGTGQEQPVAALPGVSRYSVDLLLKELERALELGIRAVLLFGVLDQSDKDPRGSRADDPAGPAAPP